MKTRLHGTTAISLCSAHEERMLDQAQQGGEGRLGGQRDLCLCMCVYDHVCVCLGIGLIRFYYFMKKICNRMHSASGPNIQCPRKVFSL